MIRIVYGWGDLIVKDQLQRHASLTRHLVLLQSVSCAVAELLFAQDRWKKSSRGKKRRMGESKRRMWQLLDADRVCAAGYTAFGEASALAPVPLRLRGQAQFGRERRSFIYQEGRTAAEAHAHTPYCRHTLRQGRQAGRQATWLHPTIWIFCPKWWWRAACSFPETECKLFPPLSVHRWCLFLRVFFFFLLSWKAAVRCVKCCSAAWYVTRIGVEINARAGMTVSLCYCVSYGLLLLISVDKLCGDRRSARSCYQL